MKRNMRNPDWYRQCRHTGLSSNSSCTTYHPRVPSKLFGFSESQFSNPWHKSHDVYVPVLFWGLRQGACHVAQHKVRTKVCKKAPSHLIYQECPPSCMPGKKHSTFRSGCCSLRSPSNHPTYWFILLCPGQSMRKSLSQDGQLPSNSVTTSSFNPRSAWFLGAASSQLLTKNIWRKKKDFFTLPKYVQFVFKRQDSNLTVRKCGV